MQDMTRSQWRFLEDGSGVIDEGVVMKQAEQSFVLFL